MEKKAETGHCGEEKGRVSVRREEIKTVFKHTGRLSPFVLGWCNAISVICDNTPQLRRTKSKIKSFRYYGEAYLSGSLGGTHNCMQ